MRVSEALLRSVVRGVLSESSARAAAREILNTNKGLERLCGGIAQLKASLEAKVKAENPIPEGIVDEAREYFEKIGDAHYDFYEVLELEFLDPHYAIILRKYPAEIAKIVSMVRILIKILAREMQSTSSFQHEDIPGIDNLDQYSIEGVIDRYDDMSIFDRIRPYFDLYDLPPDPERDPWREQLYKTGGYKPGGIESVKGMITSLIYEMSIQGSYMPDRD